MSGARHHGPSGDHTAARAPDGVPLHCVRHRPEQTTLYRLVQRHTTEFIAHTEAATGSQLPRFIKDEFDAFPECGMHGAWLPAPALWRARPRQAAGIQLAKRRGFCPSCGARRMSQTAAHLVDHVIPHVPVRQWVLSLPIPLRRMLAVRAALVPRPRLHLIRYHGVLAPNATPRAQVVPQTPAARNSYPQQPP